MAVTVAPTGGVGYPHHGTMASKTPSLCGAHFVCKGSLVRLTNGTAAAEQQFVIRSFSISPTLIRAASIRRTQTVTERQMSKGV